MVSCVHSRYTAEELSPWAMAALAASGLCSRTWRLLIKKRGWVAYTRPIPRLVVCAGTAHVAIIRTSFYCYAVCDLENTMAPIEVPAHEFLA